MGFVLCPPDSLGQKFNQASARRAAQIIFANSFTHFICHTALVRYPAPHFFCRWHAKRFLIPGNFWTPRTNALANLWQAGVKKKTEKEENPRALRFRGK